MMRKVLMILVIISTASSAQAGGPRDHDPGFFLRLSTGIGGARTGIDIPRFGREKYSGWTGDPNLAIGGTVVRNLALHATMFGWSASDPTLELAGVELNSSIDLVFLGALGIGMTYYVMPLNLYLSPSIGFSRFAQVAFGDIYESDLGVAFDFTAGKEWWVSERWALGVAGGLGLHSIPDAGSPWDWKGSSFAVRFTSTFN